MSALISLIQQISPSKELVIFFVSMTPFVEARGAIPLSLGVFHISFFKTFILTFLGNAVPLFLIWLIVPPILKNAYERFPRLHAKLTGRIHELSQKHAGSYERFGAIALALFVAVPIPGSGVWTGTLVAIALLIPWKYAAPAILVGLIFSLLILEGAVVGLQSIF